MNAPFAQQAGKLTEGLRQTGTFLIVDDFDSMRKVTANQLRHLGIQRIVEAANGAEALKIIHRQPISLVLSDWNMPVMDGLELLIKLRSSPEHCNTPFLMITAEAERTRVEQAIATGVSELLVKPYTAGLLADRVVRALNWRPRPAHTQIARQTEPIATTALPTPGSRPQVKHNESERPTILVVDDTPDNLLLVAGLFNDRYRVKIAHNGIKAIDICHSDSPPDLVLLDIMMPDMDGFEVARALRSHPSSEHIPIIFVTALSDEASRMKGLELGAVDFVSKPIEPDMLRIRVENFIRYVELHRGLQSDYDQMLATARLKEEVEHITRHDIKGPLACALGIAQGMLDDCETDDIHRQQLRMLEEAVLAALDLINLSAEIYKIEMGSFELKPAPVSLGKILHRLTEQAKLTFSSKSLNIHLEKPRAFALDELLTVGDPSLCYSAFQNLLKNACEASPNDEEILVQIEISNQELIVGIENTGTVPHRMRECFFEKFATEGKSNGTGLGTYSAKLLIEAQHGTITMTTSDTENRTRITTKLPLQIGEY